MSNRSAAIFTVLLVASEAFAQSQVSLDQWIATNMPSDEQMVCKRDVHGEFFFVARAGSNRLRLGSRLDMTEYRDTHSLATSWVLTNERGDFVVAKSPLPY